MNPLPSIDHGRFPDKIAQIVTPLYRVNGARIQQDQELNHHGIVVIDIRLRQTIISLHLISSFSDHGRRMSHHTHYVGRTAALF
jgi:hypothetical protein